jgi:hypothetical protein
MMSGKIIYGSGKDQIAVFLLNNYHMAFPNF